MSPRACASAAFIDHPVIPIWPEGVPPAVRADARKRQIRVAAPLLSAASGKTDPQTLDRLIERGAAADAKTRVRAQQAALILAALGGPMSPQARGQFAGFTAGDAKAPA